MPKAAPINANLIRAIFTYDPTTGELTPKPTATLTARRTDKRQWKVGEYRYSLNRLVWAYHHPENPNPQYIACKDHNLCNTRIENLEAKDVHPRWENHIKQIKVRFDADGYIVPVEAQPQPKTKPASLQTFVRIPVLTKPSVPPVDTTFFE